MAKVVSDLINALPDIVHLSDGQVYQNSLTSYFSLQESQVSPAAILRPQTTKQVALAVKILAASSTQFAIRSGGHCSFAGSANAQDGITIDLRDLNRIDVNKENFTVNVGTGASWGEVYRTLEPMGLSVPGGRHSQVGVGGLTLGGWLLGYRINTASSRSS